MALVIVYRFTDPSEGHIAAGALRAAGIDARTQDSQYGQVDFLIRDAVGGFAVWTPEEDVPAAREILGLDRPADPAALDWRAHPQAGKATPLAVIAAADPLLGWLIAAAMRPGASRTRKIATFAIVAPVYLAILWLVVRALVGLFTASA